VSLLLAGCAPTASAPGADKPAGSGGSGADCSAFAENSDPELKLFSSSAVAKGPTEGQKYGDGTELSITLSQEAIDAGLLPQFELLTVSDTGGPVQVAGLIFDPTSGADGTFTTTGEEFGNDELVGKAVVAEVFAVSDAKIDGAINYGQKLIIGNYCLTYAHK
jgi:hypothetical protein